MVDTRPVPSLSTDGWVRSTPMKCDYLISHFFLSERSRTYLYKDQISSLPWILQNNKDDINAITEQTQNTLEKYFGRYFPEVVVQVKHKLEDAGKYALMIYVSVVDHEGKEFSLGRLANVVNSKMIKVADLNNYGEIQER